MMNCRRVVDLLLDYVAEELPEGQKAIVDEHFRNCPPCQVYLDSYRITIRLTHQLPREAPLPPEMEARLKDVLAQIREE